MLNSYKTLDMPEKPEFEIVNEALANVELKHNIGLKSCMDNVRYYIPIF